MRTEGSLNPARLALLAACALLLLPGMRVHAQSVMDGFNPVTGTVDILALQPDGKILIANHLYTSGVTDGGLARFHPDGTRDTNFSVGPIFNVNSPGPGPVRAIAVQDDGRIVLGGSFRTVSPFVRTNIVRLLPDGSIDTTFIADADSPVNALLLLRSGKILVGTMYQGRPPILCFDSDGTPNTNFSVHATGAVRVFLQQPDGKILVGGQFYSVNQQNRPQLCRLNEDGSLDLAFNPALGFPTSEGLWSLALQADGRIVAGGNFYLPPVSFDFRQLVRLYPNGRFDSAFPVLSNATVRAIAVQRDGGIVVGGMFTNFLGQARTHLARLNHDGSLDEFNPKVANWQEPAINAVAVQPDGKILVGGAFTNLAGHGIANLGRLYPDGSADATLRALSPSPFVVHSLALQADRKILLGGMIYDYAGAARTNIARLHPDGTLDLAFNPSANNSVWNIATDFEDNILLGGFFTNVNGQARSRLARLYPNGSLDPGFDPSPNQIVRSIVFQRDGNILLGGDFTMIAGEPRKFLARISPQGILDPAFLPEASSSLRSVAVQANDQILVGGFFTNIAEHARDRIARLNPDGSIDPEFNPGADDWVRCIVVLPDNKILVAGDFRTIGGQPRDRIARLNSDGSVDPAFNPGANHTIWSVAVDLTGKIVVGGDFTTLSGQVCNRVGRLNHDGTLDSSFGSGVNGRVRAVAFQSDGKLVVGGEFSSMAGQFRHGLARFSSQGAAFESLSMDAAMITWTRDRAGAEVDLATFEYSTDLTNFIQLGYGTRTTNGWEIPSYSFPAPLVDQSFFVRARGRSFGGVYSSSSGYVEVMAHFYTVGEIALINAMHAPDGTFRFQFPNPGHHSYTAEAAANLSASAWDVLGWPTNVGGTLYEFTDQASTNFPRRFYRLRSP